ncbi:PA domain-containing protein [Aquipuribacter nitratireducens]|uniref:PA domain-containing protein n=1 Tax=Aquipuribacter nitratireducens TaxID=650104 RepID=A0ABW0GQB7_9MICO
MVLSLLTAPAFAHPDGAVTDEPGHEDEHGNHADPTQIQPPPDPAAPLLEHDASTSDDIVSSGPNAKVTKNLAVAGRGERLLADGTTDVWSHDGYAYLGTFNDPCGTGEGYAEGGAVDLIDDRTAPGVVVFDVHNPNKVEYVGNLPSVDGSRINDVKVATMSDGSDVLVHSNESCDGGPGGFEIYDVTDPSHPVHLAHVQTDDINVLLREQFGYTDFGVHNNYLFSRDGRDFNAVQVEGLLGSFQVYDITDPANVELVSWFGAEYLLDPGVDWATTTDISAIIEAEAYLFSGYGASQNRFLHDHYVTPDGAQAYLANWDAGLLLVDLGDLDGSAATLVSQAIDPASEDGEVNSHSVWPTADGTIVVEGEEDFAPFETVFTIDSGPAAGEYAASEGAITVPIDSLPGDEMSGPTVYVGLACNGDPLPAATGDGQIALIQRGVCAFTDKINNADAAGYDGVVVFNDAARGDALVSMGGDPVDLPGVFVGHSAGLLIAGVGSAADLVLGAAGETVTVAVEPNGWSGMRIWDYSNPANPVLASTFNTVCSADPVADGCDPRGTYSSHNVIVEGTKAYISWYSDGVLVLDVSDPYNPVEVARYHESGPEFEARNGGIQDVWGIHKQARSPWIYASDRNGGLYVLKEYGAGSAKQGKG